MAEPGAHSPDNPEFPRVVDLGRAGERELPFDIGPDAAEAAALAELLGARAVRKLRFHGRLVPLPAAGWLLEGSLGATVVQTCVITLDPVVTRINQRVRRRFLPDDAPRRHEMVVDPEEDDDTEPLAEHVDLGLVAVEALTLALPPYPRKPGATLDDLPAREGDDSAVRPFAGLAALKHRLDGGS